jgi:flagellar basal-body rod protein FlgG
MMMAQRRLDIVSRNIANVSTPGYKRKIGFNEAINGARNLLPNIAARVYAEQGKLEATGNSMDLAISGEGYLKLRNGDAFLYTRQGQFRRDADGLLVTPQGYVLQQAAGGDLVTDREVAIEQDGTVLAAGVPIARIALERPTSAAAMTPVGESFFASVGARGMEEVDGARLRAGMIESSNVSLGDEMTQSMLALREAESGARLIRIYDDLMGRAVTMLGQGGGR